MAPASQRASLMSATCLATMTHVQTAPTARGVAALSMAAASLASGLSLSQPAEAAVIYTFRLINPAELVLGNNSVSAPLNVVDILGQNTFTSSSTEAFTLVGSAGTRTAQLTRRAGFSGTVLLGSPSPTAAITTGSGTASASVNSATLTTTSRTLTMTITPSERGTVTGKFTVTGTSTTSGSSASWSYTANTADTTNVALTTTAVSAVASQTANTTVYVLPNATTTQAFTIQNIGDGTKAGADSSTFRSELWGTATVSNGTGWAGTGVSFNSTTTNLTDTGAATDSVTRTFTYTGAATRGTSATASITATYTSGGTNNTGSTAVTVLTGTTVAPQNATTATGSALYALPGKTASGTVNIQNVGDGSYVGASLTGTLTTTTTTGFSGSVANGAFTLADGKAPSTPAATTLTQTLTYMGQASRGASVAATVTASFANGSSAGTNASQTVTNVFTGQTVAPVASTTTAPTSLGAVRVGSSATGSMVVRNIGDGNLAGADDGATVLTNLRGNVSITGASAFSGGGAVNLTDGSSQTYMFTYAPAARGAQSATITTAFSNGSADGKNAASSVAGTVTGTGVGPDFDAAVSGANPSSGAIINGGTILFGEAVGGLTLQDLLISNLSNDVAGKSLTDLTLTNVTITGSTEFSFSLSGFDSGNTSGFGTSAANAVLSNLANGDGKGAIAIQFVNKAGTGTAQLRIETDEGAALGGAGAIYVYNLVWAVPEPGTIAVFGAGLLGLAIARRRRHGRAFVALTAQPKEEPPPSAR